MNVIDEELMVALFEQSIDLEKTVAVCCETQDLMINMQCSFYEIQYDEVSLVLYGDEGSIITIRHIDNISYDDSLSELAIHSQNGTYYFSL